MSPLCWHDDTTSAVDSSSLYPRRPRFSGGCSACLEQSATRDSGLLLTFDIPEGDQVSPFSSVRLTWRRLLRWSADVCIELCNSFKPRFCKVPPQLCDGSTLINDICSSSSSSGSSSSSSSKPRYADTTHIYCKWVENYVFGCPPPILPSIALAARVQIEALDGRRCVKTPVNVVYTESCAIHSVRHDGILPACFSSSFDLCSFVLPGVLGVWYRPSHNVPRVMLDDTMCFPFELSIFLYIFGRLQTLDRQRVGLCTA